MFYDVSLIKFAAQVLIPTFTSLSCLLAACSESLPTASSSLCISKQLHAWKVSYALFAFFFFFSPQAQLSLSLKVKEKYNENTENEILTLRNNWVSHSQNITNAHKDE